MKLSQTPDFDFAAEARRTALAKAKALGHRPHSYEAIVARWQSILDDPRAIPIAKSMARAALLKLKGPPPDRIVGEDDE